MNKIIINRGSFKLDEIVFEQGTTTIGRASNNTVTLDDTAVSSHHAKIVTLFHTSYIEDLDSTNGTLVNGKPVHKHTLHSGDVIAMGNHQLLFQSDSNAQQTSETSETVMLQGSQIKQKLNEFMQAQSELKQQSPTKLGQANASAAPPDSVKDNKSSVITTPPANTGPSSLDKEKNKAWFEPKNSPTTPGAKPPTKEPSTTAVDAKPATPAPSAESSSAHPVGNTAAAVRAVAESAPATTTPTPKTSETQPQPEKTTLDIAAAARAATQNRRQTDSNYTSNGTIALERSKPRGRVMPLIWLLIVAVLMVEVIYITYLSLG